MHDIGELILFTYEPKIYIEVLDELQHEKDMARNTLEESLMGFSHADLGAVLARKWNLPRMIKNGIFFHHNTTECDTEEDALMVAAVHVADSLCLFSGVGGTDMLPEGKKIHEVVIPDALGKIGLDEEKLEKYLDEMEDIKIEAEMFIE
ncbi:MAG TPA: HDOD domain-containing protein, partial [Deltaproteobacteria bacterium]|nr:HDOD domain-containing protein [Deltaproteobacteria bacterium]